MKKVGGLFVALFASIFMVANVSATEVTDSASLVSCLTGDAETECVLSSNVDISSSINVVGAKTLDLNDYTLTINGKNKIVVNGSTVSLTIKDSGTNGTIKTVEDATSVIRTIYGGTLDFQDGTIEAADQGLDLWGYDDATTTVKTTVTIGANAVINAKNNGAIVFWDNEDGSYGAVLNVYGTIKTTAANSMGITIQGLVKAKTEGLYPTVNIYDGAVITNDADVALYGAGYGIWNITGGTITGSEALSIKSGVYNITGGTFTATGEYVETPIAVGDGPEYTGAAISITSNSGYAGDVEISIANATVESKNGYAIYEGLTNSSNTVVQNISVSSGSYTGKVGALNTTEALTEFVSGGTFSEAIDSSYLGSTVVVNEVNGEYVVADNTAITTEDENVTFGSAEAMPNDYKLVVEEEKLTDEATIQTSAEEKINALLKDEEILDSKLIATYDIYVKDSAGNVVKLDNGKYTISIKLTEEQTKSYKSFKVLYINDNGEIAEVLDATLTDGVLTFETSHLSTYSIVGYNTVTLSNEDNTGNLGDSTTTPEETPSVPQTFDNVVTYVVVGALSIVSIVGATLYIKKKQTKRA